MGQLSRAGEAKCCWRQLDPYFGVGTILFAISGAIGVAWDQEGGEIQITQVLCYLRRWGKQRWLQEAETTFLEQPKGLGFLNIFLITLTA